MQNISFAIEIDGLPLTSFLSFEKPSFQASLDTESLNPLLKQSLAAKASLSNQSRRIAISPGHGYYKSGTSWILQRSFQMGIVEDFANTEFIIELNSLLKSAGAKIRPMRELDKAKGKGESGFDKWQESSRTFVKGMGLPESLWNSLPNNDEYDNDIRVRPLYANWRDANGENAEILVSLHNNGGGGTGTETWYDTANGFQVESKRLADTVHNKVVNAIKAQYNANWADRKVKGSAGGYGENRIATRPAIILEIAFMDTTSDNSAIKDPRFHKIVSQAVNEGIAEFFASRVDTEAPSLPGNPEVTAVSPTQLDVVWPASTDNVDVTAYRVQRDGITVGTVSGTRFTDVGLKPSTAYSYTVTARDAAGNWSTTTAPKSATTAVPTLYSGLWGNATESGWGMSVVQRRDILFIASYSYETDGTPSWHVISRCVLIGNACEGDVYRVNGGVPPDESWLTVKPGVSIVGKAKVTFTDANNANQSKDDRAHGCGWRGSDCD
jgi:N-acetylmuramoyl-L-alanine amidase